MTTIQDKAIQLLEYRPTLGMTTMDGRGFYYRFRLFTVGAYDSIAAESLHRGPR